MSDAEAIWAKAQAAFGHGNVADAVTIAATGKTKIDALAASMKLDLAEAAAMTDIALAADRCFVNGDQSAKVASSEFDGAKNVDPVSAVEKSRMRS